LPMGIDHASEGIIWEIIDMYSASSG